MSRKSGFTADWVRPKLNWTPKNPRFIIRIALPVINGLRSTRPALAETDSDVVVVMATPFGRRDLKSDLCCDAKPAAGGPQPLPTGVAVAHSHRNEHTGSTGARMRVSKISVILRTTGFQRERRPSTGRTPCNSVPD